MFALSQGIPVIGLVASDYYQWKFDGLAHHFGEGCVCYGSVRRHRVAICETMLRELWDGAADLRPVLLNAAESQKEASRSAYAHVDSLLRHAAGRCAMNGSLADAVAAVPGAWVVRSNALGRYEGVVAGRGMSARG